MAWCKENHIDFNRMTAEQIPCKPVYGKEDLEGMGMDEILDAMAALRPRSRDAFADQSRRRDFLRRCLDEMLTLARPLTEAETDELIQEIKENKE